MSETFDWLNPEDVGSFDDSFVGEFLTDDELGLGDEISRDPETGLDFSQPAKSFAEGGEVSTYTVKSGDIVSSIAQDHGTTTAAIQEANRNLDVDKIRVGQEIIIPVPDRPGYSNDSVRAAWTSQNDLDRLMSSTLAEDPLARAGYDITDPLRGIYYPYSDKSLPEGWMWRIAGGVSTPRNIRRGSRSESRSDWLRGSRLSQMNKETYKNLLEKNPELFKEENLDKQIAIIKDEFRLPERPGRAYDFPGKFTTPRVVHAHELGHMASGASQYLKSPGDSEQIHQIPAVRKYISDLRKWKPKSDFYKNLLTSKKSQKSAALYNRINRIINFRDDEIMMNVIGMINAPDDRYLRSAVMWKLKKYLGFPPGVAYDKDVDLPGLEEELTAEDRRFSRKVDELKGHAENILNIARAHIGERMGGVEAVSGGDLELGYARGGIASFAEGGEVGESKNRLGLLREDRRVLWDENEKPYANPELPTTTRTLVQKKIWAAQGEGAGITGALTKVALEAATGFKRPMQTYRAVRDVAGSERFRNLLGGVREFGPPKSISLTEFGGALQPAGAGAGFASPPVGIGALPSIQMSMSGDVPPPSGGDGNGGSVDYTFNKRRVQQMIEESMEESKAKTPQVDSTQVESDLRGFGITIDPSALDGLGQKGIQEINSWLSKSQMELQGEHPERVDDMLQLIQGKLLGKYGIRSIRIPGSKDFAHGGIASLSEDGRVRSERIRGLAMEGERRREAGELSLKEVQAQNTQGLLSLGVDLTPVTDMMENDILLGALI